MMAMAVNCLVKEASRKLVAASIFASERKSRTPYPRWKMVRPSWRTSTASPGVSGPARGAKMASSGGSAAKARTVVKESKRGIEMRRVTALRIVLWPGFRHGSGKLLPSQWLYEEMVVRGGRRGNAGAGRGAAI